MQPLKGNVAVVAGGSRGAGRGIARALGAAGATVYVLGRTVRGGAKPPDGAPGTIEETADEVSARGGVGIPVRVDCTVESEVAAAFEQVRREQGRLDVLANAVWGGSDAFPSLEDWQASWNRPFWDQPRDLWRHMMTAGPYAYLLASCHAAPLMAAGGKGLIVGVTDGIVADGSEHAAPAEYQGQLIWDLAHQCINRLMLGMSVEAKPHRIAVVTLMPGFMQTERVLMNLKTDELKKLFRFDLSESTEYIGRAVAALAADANVLLKSGKIHFVADLAREYCFTDVDGRSIPRFRP
jgi:NAD(P)-dependent dehydrogenase (short-subunit alcohol dehydrogenase family)